MPRKTLRDRQTEQKQKGQKSVSDTDTNRVRLILEGLVGNEDPDDLMMDIISVLKEGPKTPQAGKFYTFIYNPKTPNVQYDQNPLVAITDIFNWGFRGINFHWDDVRQYTWDEIAGGIYEVRPEELDDMRTIPYANIRLNI
jgi:hypothetical protein